MNNELNRELIINCWKGNLEQVQLLLKQGANINFRWDVHTYNREDIAQEDIEVCPGGVLEEINEVGMGNVNPTTKRMYLGDRVCPMDIALGRIDDKSRINPNLPLLKLLLKFGGIDYDDLYRNSYHFESDDEIIESMKIQILHEEIAGELERQNNKNKPKRKNKI